MLPHIQEGEVIEIAKWDFHDLYPGQIIAYVSEEQVLLHRIRYKVAGGYITQGDNNILLDQPVTAAAYLGVATARLMPNGERRQFGISMRLRVPEHHRSRIQVYVPDDLHDAHAVRLSSALGFTLRPLTDLKNTPVRATVGITPLGLSDEEVLIRLIRSGYRLHLICLAAFGPDGVKGVPVSHLRTTVRLRLFNYQLPDVESVMPLLSYLDGLIRGAMPKRAKENVL